MIQLNTPAMLIASKKRKVELNNQAYGAAICLLTAGYPPEERDTFGQQAKEVLAWEQDPASPTPWINIAASVRGVARDIYLQRTLAKTKQFADISAYLTGRRQGIDDAIKNAANAEALAAISIDYGVAQ